MRKISLQLLIVLLSCTLAVPESMAKRMGSGRSVGRQSFTLSRQRMSPPPRPQPGPAAPIQRTPDVARPTAPPPVGPIPQRSVPPRQASSPWGGFLGGALLGLGLGSLMGHRAPDPNAANQTQGDSGTRGDSASASGDWDQNQNTAPAAQQTERGGIGLGWLILLAVVAWFVVRRVRRRARRW